MYNFILNNADTDSIMVSKPNGSAFSKEEQTNLLNELNSLFPEKINFAEDGEFKKVIIFKAKNYILYDGKKTKSKGAATKAGNKETALKEFIQETVQTILNDRNNFTEVYNKYVKEALNVQDIKRWASRKTLTDKTFSSPRENEAKIIRAIQGKEYKEGDRVWTYFKEDGELGLAEDYNNDHDKKQLLRKLYDSSKLFASVLDHSLLYLNYSLKRNEKALRELK